MMPTLWKFYCMEDAFPGLWQRWYINQSVTLGWNGSWGFLTHGPTKNRGWALARSALQRIKIGDSVVVALSGNRVGRLGQVTGLVASDTDWNPLVPPSSSLPDGEMGRRVNVRWDLTVGPESRDLVVALPTAVRFSPPELRHTISEIRTISYRTLTAAMRDTKNWVGLASHFDYERALSGFIATFPHHLEDGLQAHPDRKLRENVFSDRTRSDVLLIDREKRPVVVECKQGSPTSADLAQLRRYMAHIDRESRSGKVTRGILVHGGSQNLERQIRTEAGKSPPVALLNYKLSVEFRPCA